MSCYNSEDPQGRGHNFGEEGFGCRHGFWDIVFLCSFGWRQGWNRMPLFMACINQLLGCHGVKKESFVEEEIKTRIQQEE